MLKAIIVDDDVNVVNGLRKLIPWEQLGYTVVGMAHDGQSGFDIAVQQNPDVIISDIVMREMDGTEFLRKIMGAMSDVAFIFISAYENFPAAQLALQYHVKGYVLKPIDRQKLQMIQDYLREIKDTRSKTNYYGHSLFDDGSELSHAIANRDRGYFEALFRHMLDDTIKFVDDIGLVRSTCERLAAIMRERWGGAFRLPCDAPLNGMKKKTDLILAVADACFSCLERDDAAHPMVEDIRRLIAVHLGEESLSLERISTEMNYSVSYVSRIFQRYAGMSITDYITMKRIEYASDLLAGTRLSVAEVACQSGFHQPNYFSHVYKKMTGCLPTEYRQMHRKAQD